MSSSADQISKNIQQEPATSSEAPSGTQTAVMKQLTWTLVGGILIVNSFLARLFLDNGEALGNISALAGVILLAAPIFWEALRDLKTGSMHMTQLVALAILACVVKPEPDYQTAGIVAFFMLVGTLIERRTALGARASIEALVKITPTKAHRILSNGQEEEVEAFRLKTGDKVRIRPGDNIPADGRILTGESSINQANITGESIPVDRKVGEEVFAGTQNLTGALDVEVIRAGEDTTLGRVKQLILEAEHTKVPFMRLVDRYMNWYMPVVLMIAGLVWWFTKEQPDAIDRAISIMIIAVPGAFILATPTAMVAALSAAARLGVLVKNVADFEIAGRLNAIIFDKTGTLTTGHLGVARLAPANGVDPAELLATTASAEQLSNHPTARALRRLAQEADVPLRTAEQFEEVAGRGVKARIDGAQVLVGRESWLKDQGIDVSGVPSADGSEGQSRIFVAKNSRVLGWIGLEDQTRPEATQAIADLNALNIKRISMVTGDRTSVAQKVAREIGIPDVQAECLPQTKVEYVQKVKKEGFRVMVVGDGVNDAPALSAGDLGTAMGAAGSDVAVQSATIALMNNDLRRIPFIINLARKTWVVLAQNFIIGISIIILGLVLSGMGYLKPIVAAILHNLGSLIVIFNSARLVRTGEELHSTTSAEAAAPKAGPAQGSLAEPALS